MAQPVGTFSSYDAIGIREQLSDTIYNVAPYETPFMTMCRKTEAENSLVEWQTDTLPAAANNAQIEGDDIVATAPVATVRLNNRTQISTKPVITTRSVEVFRKAGRKSEIGYQIARLGKALKTDVEFAICQNGLLAVGSDTTPRQTRGLEGWIAENDSLGAGGVSPVYTPGNTAPVDGTARALTESLFKEVLRLIFVQGGNPKYVMSGPFNKQKFSEFTGGGTKFDKTEDKTLYATVDVYYSDFGMLKVIPNRFQRERTLFVLDMEYWELAFAGAMFTVEELAKTGDSQKKFIVSEYTLCSKQEKASGAVRDLLIT